MYKKERAGIQVQSVARAAEIINCFRTSEELGISEIAAEMGLNKSTVFGLVNTLVRYGYLEQVESNKKYRLGISLFELGNLVLSRIDIRLETKKVCAPLAQKYPATVHIATHSAGEVIYLDKIERGDSLISSSNVGRRAPMHCTGVGKAMLAFLPASYLEQYIFSAPLEKRTPNTITSPKKLLAELETVRKTGIAMDREEIETGLTCIAAPILQRDSLPELAVSISFPYGRIAEVDQEEVKHNLLQCTRQMSALLGYRRQ
jgi:IclR family KDG regulon transcriptional repressor